MKILRDELLGNEILDRATNLLLKLFGEQEIALPAFNFDFPISKVFDCSIDRIETGSINNNLWQNYSFFRTSVPIFSTICNYLPRISSNCFELRPFSRDGIFSELIEKQGKIVFFGAKISSLTFIHYVEELISVPYRYQKTFTGLTVNSGHPLPVALTYLVRPKNLKSEYDWDKIESLVRTSSLDLEPFDVYKNIWSVPVSQIRELFLSHFQQDMLWPLSLDARINVDKKLQELGRPFSIDDFEGTVN